MGDLGEFLWEPLSAKFEDKQQLLRIDAGSAVRHWPARNGRIHAESLSST